VKIRTLLTFRYNDQLYEVADTFGYPEYDPDKDIENSWRWWYEEGSGSCDCNRSRMCGITLPCGDTIELLSLEMAEV
jgi:hypothetical protein